MPVTLALYLTLAFCALAMGWLVYRYDLYDKEPVAACLTAVVLGAVSIFLAGRLQVFLVTSMGATAAANWNLTMALAAGFTEELGKLLVVLALAVFLPRFFNDPLDGIIYGSLAGLGAAIEESLSLLIDLAPSPVLPASEPIRLAGHLVMGGISCFGVAALQRASSHRLPGYWLPLGFLAGATLHTLWDIVAFSAADHRRMLPWHSVCSIVLMLTGFLMYRGLIGLASRRSRARFAPS